MIKAAFFDIDGTLIDFLTHTMPESTLRALELLRQKGVRLFLATGRAPKHIRFMDDFFDFDGVIAFNGQYCFDRDGVFFDAPLSAQTVEKAFSYMERKDIAANFETVDDDLFNRVNDRVRTFLRLAKVNGIEPRADEILSLKQNVYQMSVFVSPEEEKKLMEQLPECKALRWTPTFINVIDKAGGKAVGLAKACERYGISREEIMAFGDGGNDVDMLDYAGIGIAMGNGGDDAKAAANHVTTNLDQDGVYNALKHFEVI